jgi:hypothetical protein
MERNDFMYSFLAQLEANRADCISLRLEELQITLFGTPGCSTDE